MKFFEDIQSEIEFFFDDLNWTYIFIYVIVLYGIKHKEEFIWYNKLFDKYGPLRYFKIWAAGLIIGTLFSFFRWQGPDGITSEYISQILRSWIIVIVFNTVFTKKIQKIEKNIDIYKNDNDKNEEP